MISFIDFCPNANLIFYFFYLFKNDMMKKEERERKEKKGRMVGKRKEGKKSEWRKVRPEITLG